MFKVKSLRSWNFNAENLDETVRFYRDFVGGEEGRTATIGGVTVAHVNAGNVTLGLFDASEGPRPGVPHHTFDVEWPGDAETVTKQLEAKGITVDQIRKHRDGPGYSLYFDDPSGNRVELSTDPE
jgi:predicted enzyme related to lactoylglutathione lyase